MPKYSPPQSLIWQPLQNDCIRVLQLDGNLSKYLLCRMEAVRLPQPKALSYTWGPPADSEKSIPILINGEPTTVRPNLHAALVSLWSQDPSLSIWADALSINQRNIEEKTAQVALMSRIYKQAELVKVWLGKLDPLSREPMRRAWEIMEAFGTDANQLLTDIAGRVFPENYDWRASLTNSVLTLFENEWFYRVWTAQEIILATQAEFWYGHLYMKWHTFEQGCKILVSQLGMQALARNPWNEIENCRTLRRKATDPRDKIFALAGLLSNTTHKADYSEEYRDALVRVFEYCIETEKSLRLLELAQGFEVPFDVSELDEELPEWPQVTKKKLDQGKADYYCTTEKQYNDYYWSDYINQKPWDRKPLSWLPDLDNMQRLSQRVISSHRTRLIPRHTRPRLLTTHKRESIGFAGFLLGGLYNCSDYRSLDGVRGCWKLIPLTFQKSRAGKLPSHWFHRLPHTFDEEYWPPPRGGDNADVLEDLRAWWPSPNHTRNPEPFYEEFDKRFKGSKHIESDVMMPTDAYDGDGADKLCVLRPVVHEIVNDVSLKNWLSNSTSSFRLEKFRFIGMIQSEICPELTIDWLNKPVIWMNFFLV